VALSANDWGDTDIHSGTAFFCCGDAKRDFVRVSSEEPHSPQNFAPGRIRAPQFGHARANWAPQSSQKFRRSSFSAWQRRHFIPGLEEQSTAVYSLSRGRPTTPGNSVRGLLSTEGQLMRKLATEFDRLLMAR
jgi:hypothetical protein